MRRIGLLRLIGGMAVAWSLSPSALWAESTPAKIRQGNLRYEQKQYDQALQYYSEALTAEPERGEIQYNLGNTLYRLDKPEQAITELKKAVSSAPHSLRAHAHYNLGNALFRKGDYNGAVAEFTSALRADSADKEAKHNLEMALRKLQEQKQEQQEKEKQKKEDSPQSDPKNDKKQEKQEKQEKQDSSTDKTKPSNPKPESAEKKQEQPSSAADNAPQPSSKPEPASPTGQPQGKELERKEAEQLLQAMEAKERQELQRQQMLLRRRSGKDRDW